MAATGDVGLPIFGSILFTIKLLRELLFFVIQKSPPRFISIDLQRTATCMDQGRSESPDPVKCNIVLCPIFRRQCFSKFPGLDSTAAACKQELYRLTGDLSAHCLQLQRGTRGRRWGLLSSNTRLNFCRTINSSCGTRQPSSCVLHVPQMQSHSA